jgi:hypothetical protein
MAQSQVTDERVPRPATGASVSDAAPPNPDHHLWRNGRLWWVAFTVHLPGWRKDRVRRSLGTADLAEARRRRDDLLRAYPEVAGCQLSLRYDEPRSRCVSKKIGAMRMAS